MVPTSSIESQRRTSGSDVLAPKLRALDPPIPEWLAMACGGCWRLRVSGEEAKAAGVQQRIEYNCWSQALPALKLVVCVDMTICEGDCTEVNALRLRPEVAVRREIERIDAVFSDTPGECQPSPGPLSTVYCGIAVSVIAAAPLRFVFLGAIPFMQRLVAAPALRVSRDMLEEYWRSVAQRWALEEACLPPSDVTPEACRSFSSTSLPVPPTLSGTQPACAPASEIPNAPSVPAVISNTLVAELEDATPRASQSEVQPFPMQPALPKGRAFKNGFLYKLGDGLLNTTWNLRYFLLLGPTLQYFRSPHEAKPRDVINLSGATVQWVKDQSRPFTFSVAVSAHRPLYLSGNNEQETCEWIDRIKAASKLACESQASNTPPSNRTKALMMSFGAKPAEEQAADANAEASMQAATQALIQAVSGDGYQLREVHNGLRISQQSDESVVMAMGPAAAGVQALTLLLVATALCLSFGAALGLPIRWEPSSLCSLLCALVALTLYRFVWVGHGVGGIPMVCASTRLDCPADELRDAVGDATLYGEWRISHLEARSLSLVPARDELLYTRFRVGLLGLTARFFARRRWIRSENGVRLLCSIADSTAQGRGGLHGFEGFAVLPVEEGGGGCVAVWLCGLDLAPWAPRWLRERAAACRVTDLAGLREWLACRAVPRGQGAVGGRSRGAGGAGARDVVTFSGVGAPHSLTALRGCRCDPTGGLHVSGDLERAAIIAQLGLAFVSKLLLGNEKLAVSAAPHGLLPHAGNDVAYLYGSRWAYAPLFLPAAGTTERPRDRLLLVVAFVVAGLHLAAASYPHLPWMPWVQQGGAATRHSAVLADDVRIRVDVAGDGCSAATAAGTAAATAAGTHSSGARVEARGCTAAAVPPATVSAKHSTFEVISRAASGYRIFGSDKVTCRVEPSASLRFTDRGVTSVELSPGGSTVRFTLPELRVRASSWRLGRGSVYEWLGSAHFVDLKGGVQCDLLFGPSSAGGDTSDCADAVAGTVRDALGFQVGRIHGSWLGPLLCDSEMIWRGPRLQPPPC